MKKTDRVAYIATPQTITIILDGKHRIVQVRSKEHRKEVITALEVFKRGPQTEFDKATLEDHLSPIKRALLAFDNRFETNAEGTKLYFVGSTIAIPEQLSKHILDFLENGLPVEALVKFWESCLRNPHYVAIDELFVFLEENQLPITDDGGFLGYKMLKFEDRHNNPVTVPLEYKELTINDLGEVVSISGSPVDAVLAIDYKRFVDREFSPMMLDVHSGTIKQKIGDIIKIERVKFNEIQRRESCGYGLHIGGFTYSFSGDVRVLCKVMPEDVIACNQGQAKLRTCQYQIVSYVDSNKEVKDLYCNLTGESAKVANGSDEYAPETTEYNFSIGEEVYYDGELEDEDELIYGLAYTVLDINRDQILIMNEYGEKVWYDSCLFE